MNIAKASQMTAMFLLKAGRPVSRVKVMKLLYLADRESLKQYGESITGDTAYSMPQGPVLTTTYDLMKGEKFSDEWSRFIGDAISVRLKEGVTTSALGDLSRADIEIIDEIWEQYGKMTDRQLVDLTHQFPEWSNPMGSSTLIEFQELLRAVGIPDNEIDELSAHADHRESIDAILGRDRVI